MKIGLVKATLYLGAQRNVASLSIFVLRVFRTRYTRCPCNFMITLL